MNCKITNVTAGKGGSVYLIDGGEKTAVHDAGMAYCGHKTVENIKKVLGERPLDYVLLSHTHYDHAGGMAYLRQAWPTLVVVGAQHGKNALEKPGALKTIRRLSVEANNEYNAGHIREDMDYKDDDLRIDRVVHDRDVIRLGDTQAVVLETPGHTKCSLSYYLPGEKIMFPSESSGVISEYGALKPSILTGYQDALDSIEKSRQYPVLRIISPHYGDVLPEDVPKYWDWAKEGAEGCMQIVGGMLRSGAEEEDIIREYVAKYRVGLCAEEQPLEAFIINAKATIAVIRREISAKL